MRNSKKILALLLCATFVLGSIGCGKKEVAQDPEPEIEVPVDDEEPITEPDLHEGQVRSKLTGLWIDEAYANERPLAIMMGNTSDAAPQSGIASAGVVYEIPVEGGITRLMSIIENYKTMDKIGSARSCRYYFVHYAMEYDALYAHFGQSKYALDTLNDPGVDNINGLEGVAGKTYYRTKDRKAPHNAYADGQKVYDFAINSGYAIEYDASYQGHFLYCEDNESVDLTDGMDAKKVRPGYSVDNPWFTYNEEDGMYYRYQYGKEHIDKETNEQLTCKNIIIQFVRINLFDDKMSLKIATTESGDGYYITNGKAIPITFSKDSNYSITHYYNANGEEITLNPGVTWVLLVDRNKKDKVELNEQ